jgi:large subunit ribosomal protein L10
MATQKKIDVVTELTEKATKAKSMVFVDYVGIKHKQLEELRKKLAPVHGEFAVTKNTLLSRALTDRAEAAKPMLKSATGTLFAYDDEVAPAKTLLAFFKAVGIGKAKGGLLGTTVLTEKDVIKLAALPTKDVLLAKLVGQLNAPIQGLHYALSWNINKLVWALNAVKENKSKN